MTSQILALDNDHKVEEVVLGFLLSIFPHENTQFLNSIMLNFCSNLSMSSWLISMLLVL